MEWATLPLKRYSDFAGRSRRKEYWMFYLLLVGVAIAIAIISGILGQTIGMILNGVFALAIIVPGVAVSIRRLHDLDKSGWWLLIGLVPLVGGVILLVFMCLEGTKGANRFGSDPLTSEAVPAI